MTHFSGHWHQTKQYFRCSSVLTIISTTPIPETILGQRMRCGKYGSLTPVIGFFSMVGAIAAYSGRIPSCNVNKLLALSKKLWSLRNLVWRDSGLCKSCNFLLRGRRSQSHSNWYHGEWLIGIFLRRRISRWYQSHGNRYRRDWESGMICVIVITRCKWR